jgi:hypothetical protein
MNQDQITMTSLIKKRNGKVRHLEIVSYLCLEMLKTLIIMKNELVLSSYENVRLGGF